MEKAFQISESYKQLKFWKISLKWLLKGFPKAVASGSSLLVRSKSSFLGTVAGPLLKNTQKKSDTLQRF